MSAASIGFPAAAGGPAQSEPLSEMAMSETAIKAAILPVTPYQQNCSLVWCTRTRKGAVIDPGGDLGRLKEALAREGVTLEKVLLTHGHLDHASGAARL